MKQRRTQWISTLRAGPMLAAVLMAAAFTHAEPSGAPPAITLAQSHRAPTTATPPPAADGDGEFTSLFNGVDLTGWDGLPALWSVEDGAITGRTTAQAPIRENTFLIWTGGSLRNFELRLKFRFKPESGVVPRAANSGIQYRSRLVDLDGRVVAGYQADLDGAGNYVGMLFEEKGRGILARPGEAVRVVGSAAKASDMSSHGRPQADGGKPSGIEITGRTTTQAKREELAAAVGRGEWLDVVVIAEGRRLRHFVNGVQTAEVIDADPIRAVGSGLLALQLHTGAPLTIQVKDILLKVQAPQASSGQAAEAQTPPPAATPAESLKLAPGFRAELIYTVPHDEQGSWVAMTADAQGRILASDQYGALYRLTPPPIGSSARAQVERLEADIGAAQGLLYAFDSLYVMVNASPRLTPGLWRLRDTDGDGRFDETKLLREIFGRGEHGPHALVLSPDGRSIYFAAGNHTALPTGYESSLPVAWGEDHLLPRLWDAKGHATGVYAPGGYIGRTDPDGQHVEIVGIGFRNQYDLAFDANGELFTYDSDMEWDQGTPWYMPTRVNHVVSGGDYGWRSGAGRWPAYYADSLPAVLDVGPGSPTGLIFGTGARFPAKYQRALFAADWTYGTMYALHLKADGASFRAQKEEFLAGKALPLTDVLINPIDGALYFTIGGRDTQSALYRVTYVGRESTAPVGRIAPTRAAKLRRSLEKLHAAGTSPDAIGRAWPCLDDEDRFVRYAARVAIERQPVALWAERALNERRPRATPEALIALARVGDPDLQPRLIAALERVNLGSLREELRLPLLRAWQLAFTRMGSPDQATGARLAAKLESHFPDRDPLVSRELLALLVYLDSPSVVAKTVPLLRAAEGAISSSEALASHELLARNEDYGAAFQSPAETRPDRQQIAYAYALRNARTGWTPELREEYFVWFPRTVTWQGGNSFRGFIDAIRGTALAQVVSDPTERARLDAQSATAPAAPGPPSEVISPQGPGRTYTVAEATALLEGKLTGSDFRRGKGLFAGAGCAACHRFNNEGGGVGPDITAAGSRYSVRDLLEAIIEPGRVVSDQYPNLMPMGLLSNCSPAELRDLLAYILSAGNPADPAFRQAGRQ